MINVVSLMESCEECKARSYNQCNRWTGKKGACDGYLANKKTTHSKDRWAPVHVNYLTLIVQGLLKQQYIISVFNGRDLIIKLNPRHLPDIALMDISMPEMDGYETRLWLKENYPSMKAGADNV